MPTGDFLVNVVDTVDACTRGIATAKDSENETLDNCARCVLSAAVFHLGKRHASLPGALQAHYDYLLRNI